MIHFLLALLVFLLIASVLLYCVRLVLVGFAVKQPFYNLAYALCILLLLVTFFFPHELGWTGAPFGWRRW
jgi:hypothetical protein